MNRFIAILLFILMLPAAGWATTYYVNNSCTDTNVGSATVDGTGYNGATGACTGGSDSYFATIADINAAAGTLAPGDTISFRAGLVWRETLTIPESGSAGNVYTYTKHGSGAKPIINGANLVTSWTDNSTGSYDFQWDMEANANTPWDFTSVTDTGGKLSRSASAAHGGSYGLRLAATGGTTQATANKTGLSYASSVYASFYVYLSSDIAYNGGHIFEARLASEWFAGVFLENHNQLFLARNKSSYAKVGSNYTITKGEWHFVEFIATGIGGASGAISMKVDGTTRASATNLDWTAGYTITNAAWGTIGAWSAGGTAGTIDFDDAWIDADGVSGGTANTWRAAATTEPKIVIFNGTRGTKVASVAACNGDKKWYWTANTLYTYGTEDPNTTYPSQIEAGARDNSIVVNGKDYITISNLNLKNSNHTAGNSYSGSDYLTYSNVDVEQAYFTGIAHYGGTNFTATGNTVTQHGACGILVSGDGTVGSATATGNVISSGGWNAVDDNYAKWNAGIKFWGGANYGDAGQSSTALLSGNTVSGQADQFGDYSGTGIWLDQWGTGAVIEKNLSHDNASYGIVAENLLSTAAAKIQYNIAYSNNKGISVNRDVTGTLVYNNTIVNNTLGGLICEGVGVQKTMANNIFKNNLSTGNNPNLQAILGGENTGGGSGNVYLNNDLGPIVASHFVEWGAGVFKDTVAAFDTAYGSATSTVSADPLLTNPAGGDFTLQAGSLAINAGVDVGLTADYLGNPIVGVPDIGAYENQPTGPTTYYKSPTGTAANKGAATGPCVTNANCMNETVYAGETFSDGDTIVSCNELIQFIPKKFIFNTYSDVSRTITNSGAATTFPYTFPIQF